MGTLSARYDRQVDVLALPQPMLHRRRFHCCWELQWRSSRAGAAVGCGSGCAICSGSSGGDAAWISGAAHSAGALAAVGQRMPGLVRLVAGRSAAGWALCSDLPCRGSVRFTPIRRWLRVLPYAAVSAGRLLRRGPRPSSAAADPRSGPASPRPGSAWARRRCAFSLTRPWA